MKQCRTQEKKCADCNQTLTYEEFCQINPSLSREKAQEYWNDSTILIFCPDCYFKLPEKPFKSKRGYYNYFSRFR